MANPSGSIEKSNSWGYNSWFWNLKATPAKMTEPAVMNPVAAVDIASANPIDNSVCSVGGVVNQSSSKAARIFQEEHPQASLKFKNIAADMGIAILARTTRHLSKLDFSNSKINDKQIQSIIPWLVRNNPELKCIDFENAYISVETLEKFLKAFPRLQELNITNLKCIPFDNRLRNILVPWIANNPDLRSLNYFMVETVEQTQEFIQAVPEQLQKLCLHISPDPISAEIMDNAFPKLAEKCGVRLRSLNLKGNFECKEESEGCYALLDRHFEALPQQFPGLEQVSCTGILKITSDQIRNTYLQWKQLKVFDTSEFYQLIPEDIKTILMHFNGIQRIALFHHNFYNPDVTAEELQGIASAIKANHSSSLNDLSITLPDILSNNEINPFLTTLEPIFSKLHSLDIDWFGTIKADMEFLSDTLGGPFLKKLIIRINTNSKEPAAINSHVLPRALEKIAKRSPNLHQLALWGNLFNFEVRDNIIKEQLTHIAYVCTSLRTFDICKLYFPISSRWPLINMLRAFIEINPNLETIFTDLDSLSIGILKEVVLKIGKTVFVYGNEDFIS